jgi:DNA adenine methylase
MNKNLNKNNNSNNSNKIKMLKDIENELINIEYNKPFLKWVGGKTQILSDVLKEYPVEMNNYHEIFLGGGSVLLAVLTLKENEKIFIKNKVYAYDFNKPLVYVYKNIQKESKKFIKSIQKIINEYNEIETEEVNRNPTTKEEALTSQESYYYWIRKKYNDMSDDERISILGSSYFVFLNKTCFRGVFRMGPNGFNVPFGHYKNPSIIDKSHIKKISELIKDVDFFHMSFEESLKNIKKEDMVYNDPPYVPMNATSFVGYTSDGFDLKLHEKLFKMLHELKKQNVKWIMSNSHTKLVIDSFNDKKLYSTQKILCRRAINSKNPDSKVNEVIIKSF